MTEAPAKHMSMAEIIAAVTDIAQDPEDRDRFKALKMLASANQATVVLPEPMTDQEITDRIGRLLRPAGKELSQIGFRKGFPGSKRNISDVVKIQAEDLTEAQQASVQTVRGLASLNKLFKKLGHHHMVRHGYPPGYPRDAGPLVKQEWCRRQATRFILDLERDKMAQVGSDTPQTPEETNGEAPNPEASQED